MKNYLILFFLLIFSVSLSAQNHIPESKSLVGIWRQKALLQDNEGKLVELKTVNYKVINYDGTFYSFITWDENSGQKLKNETTVGMYGTYEITSDSTFKEHIIKHSLNAKMENTTSILRFKMLPKTNGNKIYVSYKNLATNHWVPELWERVQPFKQ